MRKQSKILTTLEKNIRLLKTLEPQQYSINVIITLASLN
jgi:hypothetical protein